MIVARVCHKCNNIYGCWINNVAVSCWICEEREMMKECHIRNGATVGKTTGTCNSCHEKDKNRAEREWMR